MIIFTNVQERLLITDHLLSLITNYNNSDFRHELDTFWKNYFQIYKDYKHCLQLLKLNDKIVDKCKDNFSRFDYDTNNYIGLLFFEWFRIVIDLDKYLIHSSNNNYIGPSGELEIGIKGNEKYEVKTKYDI